MTVLSALQSAAVKLIARKPGAFFGVDDTFELEMTDMVNTVADDVAQKHDWQALVKIASLVGDGSKEAFDLPADYSRQMLTTTIRDVDNWAWGYGRCATVDDFLFFKQNSLNSLPGVWCVFGNKLNVYPAPLAGAEARFPYISKNWAIAPNLAPKAVFDNDADAFVLPEELLMLGLVWRYRDNKGLASDGDQEQFDSSLSYHAGKDSGSFVIRTKSRRAWPGSYPAWPFPLGAGA